ncbi:MAG: phage baseplate assembly protein [Acinetobacter sp.]
MACASTIWGYELKHKSQITNHKSQITNHKSQITNHKSQITGNDGEVLDEMEIIQQVGFSSWIPKGSRVVVIPMLGKSSRSVIVGSTEAPVLVVANEGETVIYDQWGHQILLHKNDR